MWSPYWAGSPDIDQDTDQTGVSSHVGPGISGDAGGPLELDSAPSVSENDYVTAVSYIYKLENQEETCMEIKFYLVQSNQSQLIFMKAFATLY